MDQKLNPIQPPPSVDDLLALGAEARVGQVDFANRLVPTTDAPMATVTSVLPRQRPAAVPVEAETETETETAIEPEPEAVVEPVEPIEPVAQPEAVVEPAPESATTPAAALAPKTKPAPRSRPKPAAKARPTSKKKPARSTKPTEPPTEAAAEPAAEPVIPAILPIANLSGDAVSASAAYDDEFYGHQVPAARVVADAAPTLRIPLEPVPVPVAAPAVEASADFGGTVQEVADAAIERLRDAENATLQHLSALEAEAARRAELLTAQAELDAELIRITARREAHAIISAARTQAGLGTANSRDARQLAEISDAVSRFAESIESTLAPMHSHPGHGDHA